MTPALLLCLLTLAAFADDAPKPGPVTTEAENRLLSLVLQKVQRPEGTFDVVQPRTTDWFAVGRAGDEERRRKDREYFKGQIRVSGYDPGPLLDRFFDLNRGPRRLTLRSDPARGYLVDADRKFVRYFQEEGGGWKRWHEENPGAKGSVEVSVPAFDEKAGILLVYVGAQWGELAGFGALYVYRVKDGTLTEVAHHAIWNS